MTDLVPVPPLPEVPPPLVEGRLVDRDDCPRCGRSRAQHGRLACWEIDAIAARVAHYRLPLRRRWRLRRPR